MIEAQGVGKSYGMVRALENVHLHVKGGSCFGLIGPNGAGKSTFIKLMVGILPQFDGDIYIGKHSVKRSTVEVKKLIGYVPQNICLEESLSGWDNLNLFATLYGLSGRYKLQRINQVLEIIGLTDRAKDKVSTFSGGMKRRLNIGCALLHEPSIIVLDEPTVGIDPQSRRAIFTLIKQLKSKGGTIIYSSHYMEEIEQLCDSIGFIDQGKLVATGTLQEILKKHMRSAIYVSGKGISKDSMTQYGKAKEKDNGYIVESKDTLFTIAQMATGFRDANVYPDRLELHQVKLEDIFFELTGTQLRHNG